MSVDFIETAEAVGKDVGTGVLCLGLITTLLLFVGKTADLAIHGKRAMNSTGIFRPDRSFFKKEAYLSTNDGAPSFVEDPHFYTRRMLFMCAGVTALTLPPAIIIAASYHIKQKEIPTPQSAIILETSDIAWENAEEMLQLTQSGPAYVCQFNQMSPGG